MRFRDPRGRLIDVTVAALVICGQRKPGTERRPTGVWRRIASFGLDRRDLDRRDLDRRGLDRRGLDLGGLDLGGLRGAWTGATAVRILESMLFSPRIPLRTLAAMCRRLAVATTAGIDARTVWRRECEQASGALHVETQRIRDAVSAGESVGDTIAERTYFPKLFRQLVGVGETTGSAAEVYKRLADHYEYQVSLRRSFLASLTWPAIQLAAAVAIVGVLIWAMGFIASMYPGRKPIDPLGIGLVGSSGLAIYVGVVATVAVAATVVLRSAMRGAVWTLPLQRAALHLPVIGRCLKTIALARFAWTLQLALNSAMEVRQALRLALEYSGNDHFARHGDAVANSISAGDEIHEALRHTRAFPAEFLDAVAVAEQSGALVESLERLSRQYEEQAQSAAGVLATIAGFLVWAVVAALIVTVIFRVAWFAYLKPLTDMARNLG